MSSFILGTKRGMTQLFAKGGEVVPVTVIEAGPCTVTLVRTPQRDGYSAYQLGFRAAKEKHVAKPQREFFKQAGIAPVRVLREFRLGEGEAAPALGSQVTVDVFKAGDAVDVVGTSRGRGFQGTIKRHGFHLGPRTHGGMSYRRPGSIGSAATPDKGVPKGKRMSGQTGGKRFTQKNLMVVAVDPARNLLFVRGSVPGNDGGLVQVRTAKTHGPFSASHVLELLVGFEPAQVEAGSAAVAGEAAEGGQE